MRYLLDTNICIYIANHKPQGVAARLQGLKPGDVGMSIITYLELIFGAWNSRQCEANLERIHDLEQLIPALPLDTRAGRHYGQLRTELQKKGSPIGAYDLLIAAHALSLNLILVTNNLKEFRRISHVRVENWADTA